VKSLILLVKSKFWGNNNGIQNAPLQEVADGNSLELEISDQNGINLAIGREKVKFSTQKNRPKQGPICSWKKANRVGSRREKHRTKGTRARRENKGGI